MGNFFHKSNPIQDSSLFKKMRKYSVQNVNNLKLLKCKLPKILYCLPLTLVEIIYNYQASKYLPYVELGEQIDLENWLVFQKTRSTYRVDLPFHQWNILSVSEKNNLYNSPFIVIPKGNLFFYTEGSDQVLIIFDVTKTIQRDMDNLNALFLSICPFYVNCINFIRIKNNYLTNISSGYLTAKLGSSCEFKFPNRIFNNLYVSIKKVYFVKEQLQVECTLSL